MDTLERCAFVVAQAACCNAEIAAMQLENKICEAKGIPYQHEPNAFRDVARSHQLLWNDVLTYLGNR